MAGWAGETGRPQFPGNEKRGTGVPARETRLKRWMKMNVTFGESDCRLVGIDGVENSLVAYVQLGDETDFAPDVGSLLRHNSH